VPLSQRVLRSIVGGGAIYFALFVIVHATLALTSDGMRGWNAACLLLVVIPQWILIRRRTLDLPLRVAVALAVIITAAALTGLMSIAEIRAPGGYDGWFFGGIAFDLLGLTVVGRFGTAWVTMAVVVGGSAGWAVLGDRPIAVGLALVVRHIATLAVGTALAVSLRRSNAASAAFRAVQRRRRTEEGVARARASARRGAVEQVLEQAGPMLRAIADGRRLGVEDRRQMIVIEGALRDQIRTPRLSATELRAVVDTARRRGVNVLLLDEADEAAPAARTQATRWLAGRLEQTAEGRFVGRLRDLDGGGVRVSAVRDDQGEAEVFR
jgi:post-segregation antitoxin (ccd killing protein)